MCARLSIGCLYSALSMATRVPAFARGDGSYPILWFCLGEMIPGGLILSSLLIGLGFDIDLFTYWDKGLCLTLYCENTCSRGLLNPAAAATAVACCVPRVETPVDLTLFVLRISWSDVQSSSYWIAKDTSPSVGSTLIPRVPANSRKQALYLIFFISFELPLVVLFRVTVELDSSWMSWAIEVLK